MEININQLERIYIHLADDISKEIFKNRLMYSISKDLKWVYENWKFVYEGNSFKMILDKCAKSKQMVIFGCGTWGKSLYQITRMYPWKCFIDNSPVLNEFYGIPVIKFNHFFEEYQGEYIFISSRIYHKEMFEQLINAGIPENKIVNVGKILDKLASRQYFDLENLKVEKEGEIFLDVGGFDGMTSIFFSQWCKEKSLAYIFEPDKQNIERCVFNLRNTCMEYKIIPKGAWNEETVLNFQTSSNGSSSIKSTGEDKVCVTTIDKELRDKKITFIKMDIEGAELNALIGAEEVIKKNKPKLAISIYHKPEDIWEIPNLILKYNDSYQFYLRHYSLTDYETVLYALPV